MKTQIRMVRDFWDTLYIMLLMMISLYGFPAF